MLPGLLLVMFFELCVRVNISQCHPMTANHGKRGDFLVHSSRFREFRVLLHPCVIPKPACWSTSKELVMASRLCSMHLQPNEPHQALCSSKVVDILVVQFSACWWKDWIFHLAYCWSVALFFYDQMKNMKISFRAHGSLLYFVGFPESKLHGGPNIMLTLLVLSSCCWVLRRLCKGILSFEVGLCYGWGRVLA